jgi:hypothetical protein
MQKASHALHSKLKKAQKDHAEVVLYTDPTLTLPSFANPNDATIFKVGQKLKEVDARARKRHDAAMVRVEKKHAREVEIVVTNERVQMEGELKGQARLARQAEAELRRVQLERKDLARDLQQAIQDKNAILKGIGRERREDDVEVRTLEDRCENLEAAVRLRAKQDAGKKLLHKLAMAKADVLCANLKVKLKVLDKEEGQLRYQRKKQGRQRGLDVDAVNILKRGVESQRLQMDRKGDRMTKRFDALAVGGATLCRRRASVEKDKKVHSLLYFAASFFYFLSACFPCSFDIFLFVTCLLRDCESGKLRLHWQRKCRSSSESKRIKS